MRLTKQTGHAIRILIACAGSNGGLIKTADLSHELAITKQNVFKIVHVLVRAGFLKATRGPAGGVALAAPAHLIRIGDVVRAIEETSMAIASEGAINEGPQKSDSALKAVLGDALAAFISVLDAHTLAELAEAQRPRPSAAARARRRP